MDADYVDQLVQRGLISDDVAARLTGGEPQRQSRFDILRQGLDAAKDYLTPGYFRDTPSSPQADRALADPNARPGKIGPPSGPPTGMQIAGGLAGDVATSLAPELKGAGALKFLAQPAFWKTNPAKAARADSMLAQGHSIQTIADDLEVGTSSVFRYFQQSGQKTVAAENPSRWAPEELAGLKEDYAKGMSQIELGKKYGRSPGAIHSKLTSLGDAGEVEYVKRPPTFRESPDKQELLKQRLTERRSQGEISRDPGLGVSDPSTISKWVRILKGQGEVPEGYAPQFGTGLTVAGRKPTIVQTKSQARPLDPKDLEAGRDFAKALSAFTQSR